MGYQAAFIHTTCSNVERNNSDLAKYIEIFKKYDVRCKGDWLADCVDMLHFNKTVGKYKKGMDILVISGERQAVRYAERIFDCDYEIGDRDKTSLYTSEEMKLIKRARITFVEEAYYVMDILDDEEYITRKELKLEPNNIASNYNEISSIVKSMFDKIFIYSESNGKKIERCYQYRPNNEKDEEFVLDLFKQEFGEKGYNVKVVESEETIHNGNIRIDKNIYVNDVWVASSSYLTWSERYSLDLFHLSGQELRMICKKLLEKKEV